MTKEQQTWLTDAPDFVKAWDALDSARRAPCIEQASLALSEHPEHGDGTAASSTAAVPDLPAAVVPRPRSLSDAVPDASACSTSSLANTLSFDSATRSASTSGVFSANFFFSAAFSIAFSVWLSEILPKSSQVTVELPTDCEKSVPRDAPCLEASTR